MPTFTYKAIDSSGAKVRGKMEAPDRKQVVRRLSAQKLKPVSISLSDKAAASVTESINLYKADAPAEDANGATPARKRLRLTSKSKLGLDFLRKLLELLSSGLPLGDAVKLLSVRVSDPQLKELATTLWKNLSEGRSLASVMGEMEEVFGASTAFLIEAGEATGSLVPILEKIVAYKEEANDMRNKMLASLAYPVFICTVAFGVVAFFLFFLLPKIRTMMDKLGGEMHWTAQLLMGTADFLVRFGPFIAGGLVVLGVGVFQWRKTPAGREKFDYWILRIPFIGKVFLLSEVFQTSTLMSTLMGSGINTTETLRLTEKTIRNTLLRAKFSYARNQIQEGVLIATAFKRTRFMPDIATDVLTVGENTGNMVHSLREIAKNHRRELTGYLHLLTTAISSGALGMAFILVALIALSIIMAVLNVSTSLSV